MKKLNFLISEHNQQIKKVGDKTRPVTLILILVSILICLSVYKFLYLDNRNFGLDGDTIVFIIVSPLLLLGVYLGNVFKQAERKFWYNFCKVNGGEYKQTGNPNTEKAIMFKQGDFNNIKHVALFEEGKNQTKIFQYSFSKKNSVTDKNYQAYNYTVISIKVEGSLPHIYLNYKRDSYGLNIGKKVSVPLEFEKSFQVSIPEGYHIEALEIFTPEILAKILDQEIKVDIELVDNQIYFFIEKQNLFGFSFDKHLKLLEKQYNAAATLMAMLKPRLDRFHFEKIGDLPHRL